MGWADYASAVSSRPFTESLCCVPLLHVTILPRVGQEVLGACYTIRAASNQLQQWTKSEDNNIDH